MAILDRFSSNVNEEVVVLGRIIDAIGPDVRVVSVHALVEAYVNSWAVDISKNRSSIHCLICALSNVAFNELRQVFLELWTHFP